MRATLGLLLLAAAPAAGEIRQASFASPSLGREVAYTVDLPPSYGNGRQAYPVIYALHGLFENHLFWERRGLAAILAELRRDRELPELLVVAVDGDNSFFLNGPAGRYEDLVTRDVVAHVESSYRVERGRASRMLLGVSMGGYAALRIAFTHPEVFGAVASHSAMLLPRMPTPQAGAGRWHMEAFKRVFGDPIDSALWAASDPVALAPRVDPATAPALSFDCGAQDRFGLFEGNQALHRLLDSRGVAHAFALPPGDHGYEYVRSVLAGSLRFLAGSMRGKATAP